MQSRAWPLLVGSCLLFTAHIATAQLADLARSTPEQRANAQTTFMKSKLALDAAQLEKVSALNLDYAKRFDPILKGDAGRFSKLRQIRSLEAEKERELEKLISADQFATFNASKDEMRKTVTAQIQKEVKAGAASP